MRPDLQFSNEGSFVLCWPETEKGWQWMLDNLPNPARESAVCIEHRYLEDIVLGARADGLVCEG